jgi:antitoxin ParD1/3/4
MVLQERTVMAISADLGSRLEDVVNQLVSTGRYNSKSEVLREGVRLVEEREKRLAALDAALAEGISDADAGRVKPGDEVLDRLEAKYKAMAEKNG